MADGLLVRRSLRCPLARPLVVGNRLIGELRSVEVARQLLGTPLDLIGELLLEHPGDPFVQLAPPALEQRRSRRVLDQGVLKLKVASGGEPRWNIRSAARSRRRPLRSAASSIGATAASRR